MFEERLQKYADVIVRVGLNVQPGQRVMIGRPGRRGFGVPLEGLPLVRAIARAAYRAGARFVEVNWDDPEIERIRMAEATDETLTYYPSYRVAEAIDYMDNGDPVVSIYAHDPNFFSEVNQERLRTLQQLDSISTKDLNQRVGASRSPWIVVASAVPGWAQVVFPELPIEEAIAQLWEQIFTLSRTNSDDPVAEWQAHVERLKARARYLTEKGYTALHYRASGTDLRVGLPSGHQWMAASMRSDWGVNYIPNIPTEEVFSMPHRDQIEGTVRSTMPLSHQGTLIEGIELRFENGRVVNSFATRGESMLNNILETDAGARSLGEVALVPHSSPISQSGVVFSNTLFDENASCHFALGSAYRLTIANGQAMSKEEFENHGGNTSLTHVDFMVGSAELTVEGILADGSAETVMRDGEWAFEI